MKISTVVVNIHHDEYDVYIGRHKGLISPLPKHGCFGNPYDINKYGRESSIELFAVYFYDRLENDAEFKDEILKLYGKRLGCHCKPLLCHGDVIKEYLDTYFKS